MLRRSPFDMAEFWTRSEKAIRPAKVSVGNASLAGALAREAARGVAFGLGFCLLITLIDPAHVTSLIAHNSEPRTTALILVSFFTLTFGIGATLTGLVLTTIKGIEIDGISALAGGCYGNATGTNKLPMFRIRSKVLMTAQRSQQVGLARG